MIEQNNLLYFYSSQASRTDARSLRVCDFHLVCASMLRANIDHLGELRRRKDQNLCKQHKVSIATPSRDHNFHVLSRRGGSSTRTLHQSFRRFLFEHSRSRFSSDHGALRFVAKPARKVELDYVEGHRTGHLRNGWTRVRNIFIAYQHHRHIRRQKNLINAQV